MKKWWRDLRIILKLFNQVPTFECGILVAMLVPWSGLFGLYRAGHLDSLLNAIYEHQQ